jgi:photosystem II stability/assembly factor-like uncharacterized protein
MRNVSVGVVFALTMCTAASQSSGVEHDADRDDATLRREATRAWYENEWTPDYRRFLLDAAARERRVNADKLPGSRFESASPASTIPTWVNLGPTGADYENNGGSIPGVDSGRLRSIVVDSANPAIVYLATAEGGVWKTLDGGNSWRPMTETLGSLSLGSLAMDPFDSQTLYLGLGDPFDGFGIGFVKSADGGETWSAPIDLVNSGPGGTFTATTTEQLLASPVTADLLFAATNAGLFRSTDAGANWNAVDIPSTPDTPPQTIWSLEWTGGDNYVLSLVNATTFNGEIYWSSDAGATWTQASGISNVARMTVAAAPSNRSVLYALAENSADEFADLFKSTDGGHSWTALGVSNAFLTNPDFYNATLATLFTGQGWYDQLILVSPTDPQTVYFGGSLLFAKTTDGGTTFSQISNWLGSGLPYVHADFHCGTFDGLGNLYVGNDGGIFLSTDAGQTWTSDLNVGIVDHLVYSIGSSLANPDAVIGGLQDDGTRVRSGATSTFNQPIGGDGIGSDIKASDATRMLGSVYDEDIRRSIDGGATFHPASSGILPADERSFFTRLVPWLGDTNGNTLFTLTAYKAYKTINYATSWTALATTGLPSGTPLRNIGAAESSSTQLGLIVNGGQVFLSSDSGTTWSVAGVVPNNSFGLSSISFDANNAQTIYVSSVAPVASANHLWKSTNGGASWIAIDGTGFPQGIPVNKITNDPNNTAILYAATDLGLYQSTDAGTTWTRSGYGLPLVDTTDVYVSPDSSILRVATYGRGFWELKQLPPPPTINVSPTTLPGANRATPYPIQYLMGSGGSSPYSFELSFGSVPDGMTLSEAGALSGMPMTVGNFCFTVAVADSTPLTSGGPYYGSQAYCLNVDKTQQNINFAPPSGPFVVGMADFSIAATASSGLAVTFSSLTPSTCTIVSGNLVHLVAAGDCTIAADQAGDPDFLPAVEATQTFSVQSDEIFADGFGP